MTDRPHILALDHIASIQDPIRVTDNSGNPHLHYSAQHVKAAFLAGAASLPPATDPAMMTLPPEIADHILKIGRVEWGQTHAHDADGHGAHIARSVRLTAEAFEQEGDQHMHGLWLEGTETVVAHTGTSPNAPATTQALVGMWNWFHDQAALAAAPTIPATGEADRKSMTEEWCLNMARLEEGQEIGAGMPDHPLRVKCELPPAGWLCTREPGHVGPCAAIPATGHAATEGEGA